MIKPIYIVFIVGLCMLWACSEKAVKPLSSAINANLDCPSSPNCASSVAKSAKRQVAPFQLKPPFSKNWERLKNHVSAMDRTTVIKSSETHIHAECKSRVFGFIDDLQLQLNPETGRIDLRSASRIGYWDLGVNRRRIKTLRQSLTQKEIIE